LSVFECKFFIVLYCIVLLVHCLAVLKGAKVKLFPQVCESDRFGHFCGHNGKTLTVSHQWTRQSSPST